MKIRLYAILFMATLCYTSSAQSGFHNDGIELTNDESKVWTTRFTNNVMRDSGFIRKSVPDGTWKVWDKEGNLRHIRTYSAEKFLRVKNEMRLSHPRRINYPITNLYMQNRGEALKYLKPAYSFPEADETRYNPVFREGLLNGLYMNFFPDGRSKDSGVYSNGLREGVWVEKSMSGMTTRGNYTHGKKHGAWNEYQNGRLVRTVFYNSKGQRKYTKTYGFAGK